VNFNHGDCLGSLSVMGTNLDVEIVLMLKPVPSALLILNTIKHESKNMLKSTKTIIVNSNALTKRQILKNTRKRNANTVRLIVKKSTSKRENAANKT
jgi:hypothetical protein